MLLFRLIPKCWQDASDYKDDDVDFLLEEDGWNDYGYYTTYHLHIGCRKHGEGKDKGAIYLGSLSIMKIDQKDGEWNLLRGIFNNGKLSELPEEFVSLSVSLDLYRGLSKYLTKEERLLFVDSLHLILKESDKYYELVKDSDCFNKSLLRGTTMNSFSLLRGRALLLQEGINYNLREKVLTIKYGDSDSLIKLDFSPIKGVGSEILPNGMVAFIGKNGSGKSTSLYKLASSLYESPKNRDRFKNDIEIKSPNDIGISRLMIFSYSPFDNFILPGENVNSDLKLWADGIKKRDGRFVFCGLRDVVGEAEKLISNKKDNANQEHEIDYRTQNISLKSQSALSDESYDAYNYIEEHGFQEDLQNLLSSMCDEHKDLFDLTNNLLYVASIGRNDWNAYFNSLSTGHKFFLHSMLHILAYCEENSLLLFDEPENHLQAPLLSFMMKEIRKILAQRLSVMLIATHSPIILQEILSTSVYIVRRNHDKVFYSHPKIETFGENVGSISSEVFDLSTDRVGFFDSIDEIYDSLKCGNMDSIENMLKAMKKCLGSVSSQITNYIVSKYISEHN